MENVHAGHRERLRDRYREHGLDSLSDVEALELLLFYALPRRDTNMPAHRLLERFGDFRGVLEAEAGELAKVEGIGGNAATLIRLVVDMNRRYMAAPRSRKVRIAGSEDAGKFLLPLFAYQTEERALMLCLDSLGQVIRCHRLASGFVNEVEFSLRDLVSLALEDKAVGVIIAHNHVSGTALPSGADIATTGKIFNALKFIGVELRDHIIVCEDDFVSLRDSRCLPGLW